MQAVQRRFEQCTARRDGPVRIELTVHLCHCASHCAVACQVAVCEGAQWVTTQSGRRAGTQLITTLAALAGTWGLTVERECVGADCQLLRCLGGGGG